MRIFRRGGAAASSGVGAREQAGRERRGLAKLPCTKSPAPLQPHARGYSTPMPDQSSAAREHELLRQIAEPLDSLPEDPVRLTAEVEFPTALRGYDRLAVDAYVRRTSQLVAELQARTSPHAAIRRALERVGEEVAGILQRAHETAAEITAQSRREAEERLEVARREAEQIIAGAHERVKALDADADRIWEERERILADARELARQLAEVVESAAERLPGATSGEGTRERDVGEHAPFDVEGEGGEHPPSSAQGIEAASSMLGAADEEPAGAFGAFAGFEERAATADERELAEDEGLDQRTRPFDAQELEELGAERFDELGAERFGEEGESAAERFNEQEDSSAERSDGHEEPLDEYDELADEQPTIVVEPAPPAEHDSLAGRPSGVEDAGSPREVDGECDERTTETRPIEQEPPQDRGQALAPPPARAPFDFEAEGGSLPGCADPPGEGIAARHNLGARPTV
jgi:cell division septum initiation protein DivIVA